MSEETASNTELVYVPLLGEGTIVFRPTQAIHLEGDKYELLATKDYDPEDEKWEFLPGSIVHCVARQTDDEEILVVNRPA